MTNHPSFPSRLNVSVSGSAAARFAELRDELMREEAFEFRVSCSTMVEFLVWHFRQTREHVRFDQFRPETRSQGRPRNHFRLSNMPSVDSVRPSDVRREIMRQEALDRKLGKPKL